MPERIKKLFKVTFGTEGKDGLSYNFDSVEVLTTSGENAVEKALIHVHQECPDCFVESVVLLGTVDIE